MMRSPDPIKEHVDNSFNPLPSEYIKEFMPIRQKINDLMKMCCEQIETSSYSNYREILTEADKCKDELSVLRKKHIDRMQKMKDNTLMQISLVYLNVLQESQEFLSVMRRQAQSCQEVHGELIIFDAYLITLKEHRGLAMLFLVIHLT